MKMSRALSGFATVTLIVGGITAFAACDASVEEAAVSNRRDASADATTKVDAAPDHPGVDTSATALCVKYGPEKVTAVVESLLTKVKADCRIGVYFTELPDQGAHFKGCMTLQLGTFLGCPGVSYGNNVKENGKVCRNLKDAHKDMGIRSADFIAFNEDALAALNASGITDAADVQSILNMLGTTKTAVVTSDLPQDERCTCDGGEYMGKSCVYEGGTDGGDGGDGGSDGGGKDGGAADSASTQDAGSDAAQTPDADLDAADGE